MGVTAAGVSSGAIPTNGTTIASITNGTTIVLSNTAAAVAGNLVFGLAGYANISSTSATNSFGIASAAQLINSLTLNNASNVTTIATGLQLDSGAVLALNSATINSGGSYQYLTGSNTLNREMIFHTVGAGTTLTVNAPIFSNGSGLTKADAGTLLLGTAEVYTGDTTINGGTLKLGGGQNTIFRPFNTAPTPGNSGAAVSAQNLTVNFGGALDLNGTTQSVANLRSGSGTQLMGGTIINSSATTAATLNVALNGNQTWAGNISNGQTIGTITGNTIGLTGAASGGALSFVRDGNNTLTVNSPNTFSGSATILGGATTLVDLGTFQNATAVNVTRAALIWNDQGVQAVSNRLSSTAPITLTGGGLQFLTRAGSGSNPTSAISLGTLNLGTGASNINVSNVGQGSAASVTFSGLGTRATGGTLTFGTGTYTAGSDPDYFITGLTNTNGIIGGWATVNSLTSSNAATNIGFATYDPAAGVRILQYQPTATYGAGVNAMTSANTTIPGPLNVATTTTVNSLSVYNGTTLSFTNAFDTLLVQSGGILFGNDNNGKAIGSVATPGQIVSGSISNGGSATNNDLFIYAGANNNTINSKIIDNGANNNVIISGPGAAGGTIILTNANTYGGTTYLNSAPLNLNSLLGPAIPNDLIVSGGTSAGADSLGFNSTTVNWSLANQIAPTANITMNGATQLNLGSGTLSAGPERLHGVEYADDQQPDLQQ